MTFMITAFFPSSPFLSFFLLLYITRYGSYLFTAFVGVGLLSTVPSVLSASSLSENWQPSSSSVFALGSSLSVVISDENTLLVGRYWILFGCAAIGLFAHCISFSHCFYRNSLAVSYSCFVSIISHVERNLRGSDFNLALDIFSSRSKALTNG